MSTKKKRFLFQNKNSMKGIFTILIICVVISLAMAQTSPLAPDFTITTSDGMQRSLYADYLDKGKAVVLKLFFTTCPICIDMAPLMEPFYYEWGSGNGPVEFISLSTRANDSNDDVHRYKAMLGHSFPGAGNDGGGLAAIQPYINNTYGFFSGTPTFVVIAPNKTVTYNPKGSNFEATIDSIDQALRRTGIAKPAVAFNLSGTIATPDSGMVGGVKVKVRDLESDTVFTDSTGYFNFSSAIVARDNYRLQLEKNDNHDNGITTFDIVKVQRHVLGIEPLTSPYELLAADVDRSGAVTVADILQLRRIILHVDIKFAKAILGFLSMAIILLIIRKVLF
ncbi:MAG: redoxin domain-containing protein [Gammaproteobacteria bacterium]|nr:redoxin domain-containing protein [Gammaproteobacteria bacterium]